MTDIDWDVLQKEAKTAAALPDGEYNAFVLDTEATTSSTGKPMIKAKYRITDGPGKDRKVSTQFVISADSPVALRIFFQHMAQHGLDAAFFATKPPLANVAGQLKGKYVTVVLGTRQWQGSDMNEVKGFKPFAGTLGADPTAPVGAAPSAPSPLSAPPTPPSPVTTPVAPGTPPPTTAF